MELLERDALLDDLLDLVTAADGCRGRLVLLTGEAGVGKTSVIRALEERLKDTVRVLIGGCDPLSTPRPLAPLEDIAPTIGGDLRVLLGNGADKHAIFQALIAELARFEGATVIVLEDVHWADESTLDLLRFLGRRIADTRGVVIATYRDDEIGPYHPLRMTLGDLATSAGVRRIAIPRLSEQAVSTLIGERDYELKTLYRRTGGNPFFVTEVLATDGRGIPQTVSDAVLTRAARLSPAGREVLTVAAVIGNQVEPWILSEVASTGSDALAECLATGTLLTVNGTLVFRHELAREAMLSTISPDRLIELHTDILATLESSTVSDQDPARLAHHAEGARHTEAVLRYAVAAAERARNLGAHRQAAAQYARALRFAEGLDASKRAELLEASSTALYITDRWSEATEAREKALAIWRAIGDVRREGDNLRWLSRLLWVAGRNRDAERIGQEAIAVLETLPPGPELAMAYSNLSQLSMLGAEYADSIAWGEKAIALANTANDVQTLVHARINVGTSRLQSNDERGLEILDDALQLAIAEKMGDHAGRAYANICAGSVEQRRFAIANKVLAEGIAFCREYDLDFYRWYLTAWQGVSNLYQGRWSDIDEALEAIALDSAKTPTIRIPAMFVIGSLFARRGDPRSASILETALELAAVTGEMQRIGPVRAARAEAAWLAGDVERTILEARAEYDNALRLQNPWLSGEYAYRLWRAGDLTTPPAIAVEPYARQIRGDWSGAANLWDQLGCPYEAARARAESEDETALRQAWSVFDALSARPDQNALMQRMRSLGIRNLPRGSRISTRANPAHLTAREVDVLRNLALGRTNPEIGRALFLSPKTIEHHVSAILAKLGVSSRREALAVAGERGLLDQYRGAPA